jgi:hypothetical protein
MQLHDSIPDNDLEKVPESRGLRQIQGLCFDHKGEPMESFPYCFPPSYPFTKI